MATPKFSTLLLEWRLLSMQVQDHQTELPNLQASQEQLAALVEEGSDLSAKILQLSGQLKEAQARRDELIRRANHVREFLTAGLRERYGVSGANLLKFGVKPRVGRGPGRKNSQPAGSPEDSQPATN